MVKSLSRKPTRLQKMKFEIAIKDKLIILLIKIVAENKIKLPDDAIKIIEKLYKTTKMEGETNE